MFIIELTPFERVDGLMIPDKKNSSYHDGIELSRYDRNKHVIERGREIVRGYTFLINSHQGLPSCCCHRAKVGFGGHPFKGFLKNNYGTGFFLHLYTKESELNDT